VSYLLNLLYLAALALVFPWLLYAAIFKGKYREGFAEKFLGRVPPRSGDRPCIWLHAVSVGEVNLLGTLLDEIERRRPDVECVISTTTMTGFALAKKKYALQTVFYCPLDFSWAVRTAVRRIRPSVLVLAELELWPNLIRAAKEQGAKVAVVNGRLSEKSFRGYRRIRPLASRVLQRIDVIAAQNETYARRFQSPTGGSGPKVVVTGSLKFDGAQTERNNAQTRELAALAGIAADDVVFLAGSTQAPEEALALAAFAELAGTHANLRLIIVPRHPDRFDEVAALLQRSGWPWRRRSELESVSAEGMPSSCDETSRILLVDTIGELGAWWGTADIAYVGGSMGRRGGQNMIEPAAYGAAVSFGPNTWNFRDVVQMLLAARAAQITHNGAELTAFVRRCLQDPAYAARLGASAQRLVRSQLGTTSRTVDVVEPLLPKAQQDRIAA